MTIVSQKNCPNEIESNLSVGGAYFIGGQNITVLRDKESMCKERRKILRAAMATWTKKVDGF